MQGVEHVGTGVRAQRGLKRVKLSELQRQKR
jgi:hypothetical protein